MVIGNPGAHKELGQLVERLRALTPHLHLPEVLLRRYEEAVGVLSEVAGAIGAPEIPVAAIAHNLQFSPMIWAKIRELINQEKASSSDGSALFGPYFNACATAFPKAVMSVAERFGLDPLAIMTAVDNYLEIIFRLSDKYRYNIHLFRFPIARGRLNGIGGVDGLSRVVNEAFEEVINAGSIDAKSGHVKNELGFINSHLYEWVTDGMGRITGGESQYANPFLLPLIRNVFSPLKIEPVTHEEKAAYCLLGNAVLKGYEFFAKP